MSKIVKVLAVTDTREYEEINDRWVAIPGSGQEHECSRCGRLHEVHAEVLLDDGSTAIVGTGCASNESMDVQGALRRGASAAKRLASLEAEKARLLKTVADYEAITLQVNALPLPEVTETTKQDIRHDTFRVYVMGDAEVWDIDNEGHNRERLGCLIELWRGNRAAELGMTQSPTYIRCRLRAVNDAIAKVQKRMNA